MRRQRADTVMVNDLDDLHLIRALHRLREFVVIHQDQLARHGLEEIRLRQNAHGAGPAHRAPGKSESPKLVAWLADRGQRRVFAKAQKLLVQHMAHGHRRATQVPPSWPCHAAT